MSLEAAMAELTAAITEQTKFLKSLGGGTTAAKATPEKPATPAKPKKITLENVTATATAYLQKAKEGTAARAEATKNLQRICQHLGLERISLASEDQFDTIISMLQAFARGEEPAEFGEANDEAAEEKPLI